jgi:hypothetical protein
MEFLDRDPVIRNLDKKVGLAKSGWLSNRFGDAFQSEHVSEKLDLGDVFSILEKFLLDHEVRDMIILPDSVGWTKEHWGNRLAPIVFMNAEEALVFLRENILNGADNYYLMDKDISWILTVCHEEDMHISGPQQFVLTFQKRYL